MKISEYVYTDINFPSLQFYWHLKVWVITLDMATCFDPSGHPHSVCSGRDSK